MLRHTKSINSGIHVLPQFSKCTNDTGLEEMASHKKQIHLEDYNILGCYAVLNAWGDPGIIGWIILRQIFR
jgi:hypothetical protein